MSYRVALRFLLARAQLAPALDQVEHLVKAQKWREALDAIREFGKTLGVFFTGDSYRVSTEWFSGLDREDKDMFLSFVKILHNLFEMVHPFSVNAPWAKEDDRWYAWIESLRRDLPQVQDLMRDESDAFKHGKFQILPLKGVTNTDEAVKTLDEASGHIQSKFPQVLYGKVYIRKDLHPKGSYEARPGAASGGQVAGAYQGTTDTITLSMYATPERNSVMTLIHEFGHRYHTRFLHGDLREKFIQLSTVGDIVEEHFSLSEREKFADEYIARKKGFRDDESFGMDGPVHLSPRADFFFDNFPRDEFKAQVIPIMRKFDDGDDSVIPAFRKALARSQFGGNLGVVKDPDNVKPVYASTYGETSWEENFAESFLAFCMHKVLPEPLQRFMESL